MPPSRVTTTDGIKGRIRSSIARRELVPGQKLPTVRALAREMGVCTGTMAKAFRELRMEGVVRGHQGKGVFVRETLPTLAELRVEWLSNMNDEETTTIPRLFAVAQPHCRLAVTHQNPDAVALPFELVARHAGELEDIGGVVAELYGRDAAAMEAFGALRVAGRLCILPVTLASFAVAVNRDLLGEAGLAVPGDDWTHEQWLDAVRRLTQTDKGRYGFAACRDARLFATLVWQHGGHLFDALGSRCLLAEPEALAAARLLREMSRCSPPLEGPLSRTLTQAFDEFLKGRTGMAFMESWCYQRLQRDARFRFSVLPVPSGRICAPVLWGNGFGIRRGALTDAARDFLGIVAGMEKWPSHVCQHGPIPLNKDLEKQDEAARAFAEARDHGWTVLADIEPHFRSGAHVRAFHLLGPTVKQIVHSDAPLEATLAHTRDMVNEMLISHVDELIARR